MRITIEKELAEEYRHMEEREKELNSRIRDYLDIRNKIPLGLYMFEELAENKERILNVLGGTEDDWNNWKWQMENRIDNINILTQIINLKDIQIEAIREVSKKYRWAVSPYYASLMDLNDERCPVRLQAIPSISELNSSGKLDPMAEKFTSPAPAITRRYPDRLIINVTNQCPMYCRHCQRRRNLGELDKQTSKKDLILGLEYIKKHPEIRDVLITGGDALMLSDEMLNWILTELDNIPHVEIKRLGTRTPVTLPQRITPRLCNMLEKHHPVYINTQFNHSKEITEEAAHSVDIITKAGIPLGNQAVLLKGVNNDSYVMKRLNQALLQIRVRPYYLFHPKDVRGTAHFKCAIKEGIEIMEKQRGYTSGLSIPAYILNAPEGKGKIPLLPQYILKSGGGKTTLRTWEGQVIDYPDI